MFGSNCKTPSNFGNLDNIFSQGIINTVHSMRQGTWLIQKQLFKNNDYKYFQWEQRKHANNDMNRCPLKDQCNTNN